MRLAQAFNLLLLMSVAAPAAARVGPTPADEGAKGEALSEAPPISGDENAIVVTADRRYGKAEVAAEAEFDEADIAAEGTDSVQELLDRLAPFIGDNSDEPVLLINGRPADFDRSILSYPPEALQRLVVLKREASAHYGRAPGKRVVNLVLKKSFASLTADTGAKLATAGGQYGGNLSIGRVAISGPTRWNAQASVGYDSALRRSSRPLQHATGIYDKIGFVRGIDGREIDPGLSALAGHPVTLVSLTRDPRADPVTLAELASGADDRNPVDPARFETLTPARRNLSLNIGVTRPLSDFFGTLNLTASRLESEGLRGLPMASFIVPATNPWSPFAGDVEVVRPLAGVRALHNDSASTSFNASLTLSGEVAGWQTSLSASYSRNHARSLLELGVDHDRVAHLVAAGSSDFDPFGPWPDGVAQARLDRSVTNSVRGRLTARKSVADLPAGALTVNFSATADMIRSTFEGNDSFETGAESQRNRRDQINGQATLSIPLSRRKGDEPSLLGDLAAGLSIGVDATSQGGVQKRFDGNLDWSPLPFLELRGSFERAELSPSFEQLDGPTVSTIRRVFDYAREEIAEPIWITGGNPSLARGNRETTELGGRVTADHRNISLDVGYRRSVATGAIASFPDLTPAIEAAFPERIMRDTHGRLVSVDARVLNLARQVDALLTSRLSARLSSSRAPAGTSPTPRTADPVRITISLTHRWQLADVLLVRAGLPKIDQLEDGGRSRHSLSFQASAAKRGIGATLRGNWSSAARVGGEAEGGAFRSRPPIVINVSVFLEPEDLFVDAPDWLENLRISVDLDNVLDDYRHVSTIEGGTASGFSHYQIDPVGRTAGLQIRKRF